MKLEFLPEARSEFLEAVLDELRASAEMEVFRAAEKDEEVIGRIVDEQREELEEQIGELKKEADRIAEETKELAGEVPF